MTNDEARMTKEIRNPNNDEELILAVASCIVIFSVIPAKAGMVPGGDSGDWTFWFASSTEEGQARRSLRRGGGTAFCENLQSSTSSQEFVSGIRNARMLIFRSPFRPPPCRCVALPLLTSGEPEKRPIFRVERRFCRGTRGKLVSFRQWFNPVPGLARRCSVTVGLARLDPRLFKLVPSGDG
jgi:hypothetical protein